MNWDIDQLAAVIATLQRAQRVADEQAFNEPTDERAARIVVMVNETREKLLVYRKELTAYLNRDMRNE